MKTGSENAPRKLEIIRLGEAERAKREGRKLERGNEMREIHKAKTEIFEGQGK